MRWYFYLPALTAIGLSAVQYAHAQDDYRRTLIRTLQLTKTERVALKRLAASEPQLAPCLDRLATDERLEADLLPVVGRSVPTPESARPALAFLLSSTGKKFSAVVERRQPELKPNLLRPVILPGGVPVSSNEFTANEIREISDFFRSDHGAVVFSILRETAGFAQLTRGLSQRKTFAAECGVTVR